MAIAVLQAVHVIFKAFILFLLTDVLAVLRPVARLLRRIAKYF